MTTFVLLHGFAQSTRAWDEVARLLRAQGHEACAFDLGECACEGLDLAGVCERVARACEDAALPVLARPAPASPAASPGSSGIPAPALPVLVGYSMGGRIALEALVRCGSGDRGLPVVGIVLESAGLGPVDDAARAAFAARSAAWVRSVREQGVAAFMEAWADLPLFASQRALPASVRARVQAERVSNAPAALVWQLEELGQHRQADEAASLAALARAADAGTPVLYLAGELDEKYAALARRVDEGAPAARVKLVAGAGHNTHLEQAQSFVAALVSFARNN
ncbi:MULTISPECIES: alpha/beta fold hydrolase [unclassified Adlercreutzia]|uniref:alpha/beta fold hydrolase n=1 Tax=unclassified Adlercreutzia TaxID=2636013 RepID=UPI0013EDA8A4|nr:MULTISPECIES: alpha/beta fold hydrolase [unclassified Adlercreutzia]